MADFSIYIWYTTHITPHINPMRSIRMCIMNAEMRFYWQINGRHGVEIMYLKALFFNCILPFWIRNRERNRISIKFITIKSIKIYSCNLQSVAKVCDSNIVFRMFEKKKSYLTCKIVAMHLFCFELVLLIWIDPKKKTYYSISLELNLLNFMKLFVWRIALAVRWEIPNLDESSTFWTNPKHTMKYHINLTNLFSSGQVNLCLLEPSTVKL